ncbi:MAG: tandem-95 repeat protein [Bacteroidota bacterium]|nr:tandem-95 repeat protein [Bacteroidota bacterium]
MKRLILISILLSAFLSNLAQPNDGKHYMIPDIGTPGYATKIEIISKYSPLSLDPADSLYFTNTSSFFLGSSSLFSNNIGDSLRVVCENAADYSKVSIGPVCVGWDGQLISAHIFVHENISSNSYNWAQLDNTYKIPIGVMVSGNYQFVDTFYIVQPQPALISVSPTITIGSGAGSGIRSPRGAMIFESFSITGTGMDYHVSTSDCDPYLEGNQGYLPVNIISLGNLTIGPNTHLSLDAYLKDAAPGGGGGGAGSVNGDGGNGFTAGGYSCTPQPFDSTTVYNKSGESSGKIIPSPQSNNTTLEGNYSLNGIPGGLGRCDQGGGGGTGHPLGYSGAYGEVYAANLNPNAFPGMYGGGSAGGEINAPADTLDPTDVDSLNMPFGGGGGGNGSMGEKGEANYNSNGGKVTGNKFIVPFGGGSGGGAGNVWSLYPGGSGGGGGGGIALYSYKSTNIGNISANGGNGGNGLVPYASVVGDRGASGGGGGSGGSIIIGAKISNTGSNSFEVDGGEKGLGDQQDTIISHDGGNGGSGRIRIDGNYPNFTNQTDSTTFSNGPTIDDISLVQPNFTLTGTGNGENIRIYIKPTGINWYLAGTTNNYSGSTWSINLSLDTIINTYYIVAIQENPVNNNEFYIYEPSWVLSQVSSNIIHVNEPPIAADDSLNLFEGDTASVNVLANDFDPYGGQLGVTILNGPYNGQALVLSNNNVEYIPNNNYFGLDTIQVIICDGLACDTSFIYIQVFEQNDPPITEADFVVTDEDIPVSVFPLLNDYDPDPLDILIISGIAEAPIHGTYQILSDSLILYTPDLNYYGQDFLIYEVCNTIYFPCSTDTIFFTINPVNDSPVVFLPGTSTITNEILTTTLEDTPVTFCFDFFDFDGDIVSISDWYLPNPNGIVIDTLTDSICITYMPDENFNGLDTVEVYFCDDQVNLLCDTVLLIIDVIPVNDSPVVFLPGTTTPADVIITSTPEDTPITFCFDFFDYDGDTVAISGWFLPNPNGIVIDTLTDSICITYMPDANFNGLDSIEVYFCDNQPNANCDTVWLIIDVLPVNDCPLVFLPGTTTATDIIFTTIPEDSVLTFCFDFFDIDMDTVSISGWNLMVPNGIVIDTLSDSICITYLPNENFFGLDSIAVYFCDNNSNPLCDTVLLIIDVTPVNDCPVIIDPVSQLPADTLFEIATSSIPQIICLDAFDADNDSLFIQSVVFQTMPGNGTINLDPPDDTCFVYTSDTLFSGFDTVQVIISDGLLTDTIIIVINVIPFNNPPLVINEDGSVSTFLRDTTLEEEAIVICIEPYDVDGHSVSIDTIYSTTGMALIIDTVLTDSCFVYKPAQGFVGSDTVEVKICDDGSPAVCNIIPVYIEVMEINDPPIILNEPDTIYTQTNEDTPLEICFEAFDEENDSLAFSDSSISLTGNGGLLPVPPLEDLCIEYTPNSNFWGIDTLIVYLCDNGIPSYCDSVLIIIDVIPVNDPPLANNLMVTAYIDRTIEIDLSNNVYDPDDEIYVLSFSIIDSSKYGIIENYSGLLEYTPKTGYNGQDTLVYKVCDDEGLCDEAYIFILVDYEIFLPNAFSPNGDGINDYFEILHLENFTDEFDMPLPNKMEVFNRWGNLVFSIEGYNNDDPSKRWSGQSNTSLKRTVVGEKLPEGTYFYYFTIKNAGIRESSFVIIKY